MTHREGVSESEVHMDIYQDVFKLCLYYRSVKVDEEVTVQS